MIKKIFTNFPVFTKINKKVVKNNWEPKGNGKDGFPYYICVKAK